MTGIRIKDPGLNPYSKIYIQTAKINKKTYQFNIRTTKGAESFFGEYLLNPPDFSMSFDKFLEPSILHILVLGATNLVLPFAGSPFYGKPSDQDYTHKVEHVI